MSRHVAGWIATALIAGAVGAQDAKPSAKVEVASETAGDKKKVEVVSPPQWQDARDLEKLAEKERKAEEEKWLKDRLARQQANGGAEPERPVPKVADVAKQAENEKKSDSEEPKAAAKSQWRRQQEKARLRLQREKGQQVRDSLRQRQRETRAKRWQKLREEMQRRREQREGRRQQR